MQLFLIRMLFFVVSHHFHSGGKGSLYVLIGATFSGILLPLPFGHTYLNMILLVNSDVLCDLKGLSSRRILNDPLSHA